MPKSVRGYSVHPETITGESGDRRQHPASVQLKTRGESRVTETSGRPRSSQGIYSKQGNLCHVNARTQRLWHWCLVLRTLTIIDYGHVRWTHVRRVVAASSVDGESPARDSWHRLARDDSAVAISPSARSGNSIALLHSFELKRPNATQNKQVS